MAAFAFVHCWTLSLLELEVELYSCILNAMAGAEPTTKCLALHGTAPALRLCIHSQQNLPYGVCIVQCPACHIHWVQHSIPLIMLKINCEGWQGLDS